MSKLRDRVIVLLIVIALLLLQFSTIAFAATSDTQKAWNTETEATVKFGLSFEQPDHRYYKINYKENNGNGSETKTRAVYRTYLADENGTEKDYSKNIFCLDLNGKFPKETNMGNNITEDSDANKENYKSKGEITASTTINLTNSKTLDTEKVKKILAILNKGYDYATFEAENTEQFAAWLDKIIETFDESDDPPTGKEIIDDKTMTKEKVFILEQVAIWEVANDVKLQNNLYITNEKPSDLNGNGKWNTEAAEKDRLAETAVLNYFRNLATNADQNQPANNLSKFENKGTTSKTTTYKGAYAYVGPFKISNSTNISSAEVYAVKNGTSDTDKTETKIDDVEYYSDSNGNSKITDIKNVGVSNFYIRIPKSSAVAADSIKIKIKSKYKKMTLWVNSTEENSVTNYQPLVSVSEEESPDEDEANIEKPKYDVALRKYITKINGEDIQESRAPTVTKSQGSEAFNNEDYQYKHKKNPVKVHIGDKVTYTIQLYNECEDKVIIKGIKDYLPDGLELVANESEGWTAGTDGENCKFAVLTKDIQIDGTDLSSNEIKSQQVEITCLVKNTVSASEILTNVAEITNVTDENNTVLTKEDHTEDDSTGGNLNAETKKCPSDYDGGSNENDLNKTDYYYYGEEDDDDFEKLLVEVEGKYSVELLKTDTSGSTITSSEATFDVETKSENALPRAVEDGKETKTTNQGKLTVAENVEITETSNIDVYTIEEITPPKGYKKLSGKIEIRVTKTQKDGSYVISSVDVIEYNEDGTQKKKTTIVPGKTETTDGLIITVTDLLVQIKVKNEPEIPDKPIDLALRKYIRTINGKDQKRDPNSNPNNIDTSDLDNNTATTADYEHPKNAIDVSVGDIIIYTVKVYNEGDTDAYASEVTDYIPEGLGYLVGHNTNIENGWTPEETDGTRTVKYTELPQSVLNRIGNHLSASDFKNGSGQTETSLDNVNIILGKLKVKTENLKNEKIPAYNKNASLEADRLQYRTLQLACIVLNPETYTNANLNPTFSEGTILKNIAAITKEADENNTPITSDRDSQPNEVDPDNYPDSGNQQDDDDYDNVVFRDGTFDLALKKYITTVKTPKGDGTYVEKDYSNRFRNANGDSLTNSEDATYDLDKTTVKVKTGDTVVYTIKVFNEGDIVGYATEIADNLPEGLEFVTYSVDDDGKFVSGSKINYEYGWELITNESGEHWKSGVRTSYLANKPIDPYDKTTGTLDSEYVQIELRVVGSAPVEIKNIAEILDDNGNDRDSTPKNEIESEDDEDYDVIIPSQFDLGLQKFITKIDDKEMTNRTPVVTFSDGKIKYSHPQDAVVVVNGNKVTYTIRVYNEGNTAGFPSMIKDDLPDGITFLKDSSTNQKYGWKMYKAAENGTVVIGGKNYEEVTDVGEAEIIATDYYSYEKAKARGESAINGFNESLGVTNTNPDYRDLQVEFEVTEKNMTAENRIITNTAEIADDQDDEGNPIDDIDSTPNNDKDDEDDIDKERLQLKYFDLSLLKYVSEVEVTEDGKKKTIKTKYDGTENPEPVVKIDINKRKLNKTEIKYTFSIKVTNEGEIEGYATEITDYIPSGLEFKESDNKTYRWKKKDKNTVTTDYLKDKLLKPGESAIIKIVLRWKKSSSNLGQKINTAEISEDKNEYNVPDIDSTPNNKRDGEDDIDDAPVILSIKTGGTQVYIILTLTIISILSVGGFIIYKYVYRPQEDILLVNNNYTHKRK